MSDFSVWGDKGERRFHLERPWAVPDLRNVREYLSMAQGVIKGQDGNILVAQRRTHTLPDQEEALVLPATLLTIERVGGTWRRATLNTSHDIAMALISIAKYRLMRHRLETSTAGVSWTIDLYGWGNDGFSVARCPTHQLDNRSPPNWCGAEITDESRLTDLALAEQPLDKRDAQEPA